MVRIFKRRTKKFLGGIIFGAEIFEQIFRGRRQHMSKVCKRVEIVLRGVRFDPRSGFLSSRWGLESC